MISEENIDYKSWYHYSGQKKEKNSFNVCQSFLDNRRKKMGK